MKIAFIVHDYRRSGGHGRYVVELATRFAQQHEVHVFASVVEGDRDPRIRFHYVPSLRINALSSVMTFILPASFLRLKSFDIVHAQGLCGLKQNVLTAHMCLTAWFKAQQELLGGLSFKQKIFRFFVEPLEKYTFRKRGAKAVIAISKLMESDLKEYYARTEDVHVIYHGVDLNTFHPGNRAVWREPLRKSLGIPEERILALYVGNLQKGAAPAIGALSEVENVELVCVSASDAKPYSALAIKLGVKSRVHFEPATPHIARYYAAADVFLFPSAYDPFGMVITEAMAAGLPVLTSRSAGASELLETGVHGAAVDPAWNVEEFVFWLKRIRDEPSLRERMGRAARARIEKYTWDATAAETLKVYEKVLEEKRSHSNGRA